MKSLRFYIFLFILLSSCKREELPIVTTGNISSITQTSAFCKGYVFSQGSCEVISKGICWGTSSEPTVFGDTITTDSSKTFTIKLTNLKINTTYYVRSFAINCAGIAYGEIKSFITNPPYSPKVQTYWGDYASTTTSATTGGLVTSDGGAQIVDRGVSWTKSQYPDSSELIANGISAGSGLGSYFVTITGLNPNTDYFVRAYATNMVGTGYGDPILITTKFVPNPNLPVDYHYPTTFYKLDSATLSDRKIAFDTRNKFIVSSLDEFGFCSGSGTYTNPPHIDNITQEEVIEVAKNFVSLNEAETGIKNPNDLIFAKIFTYTVNNDIYWSLQSSTQRIGSTEVVGPIICFLIINKEVIICNGNWYPDIYIPQTFNIKQELAKNLLIGRVLGDSDLSGYPYYMTISSDNMNSASIKLAIVPIRRGQTIQLRVTWEIYILHHKVYVDVMSGEIVNNVSMIIS